jgi:hypothetical protein
VQDGSWRDYDIWHQKTSRLAREDATARRLILSVVGSISGGAVFEFFVCPWLHLRDVIRETSAAALTPGAHP